MWTPVTLARAAGRQLALKNQISEALKRNCLQVQLHCLFRDVRCIRTSAAVSLQSQNVMTTDSFSRNVRHSHPRSKHCRYLQICALIYEQLLGGFSWKTLSVISYEVLSNENKLKANTETKHLGSCLQPKKKTASKLISLSEKWWIMKFINLR